MFSDLTASQCNERPAQANFTMVDKDTKTKNEMVTVFNFMTKILCV